MKKYGYLVLLALCLSVPTQIFAQKSNELDPGYYVVVGAYAQTRENIAQNYVEALTRRGLDAYYGFNTSRKLYFVYLKYFEGLKESLRDMSNTRKKSEFSDAWVRVVPGDVGTKVSHAEPSKPVEVAKQPEVKVEPVVAVAEAKPEDTSTTAAPPTTTMASDNNVVVTENPPIRQYDPITLGNTEVFISLFQGRNNRIVDGEIKVIDTDRARMIKQMKGNEYLLLPDPKSKSGQLTLIAEVFGYRKVQQDINYPLPLADTVKEEIDLLGTTFVINFDMVRYHKGDIATLYNVYFYNDAALMDPKSKYELNSLLQMLQENAKYKITLHGHSNGNYHGKILTVGDEKDYFSLKGAKEKSGSAKELSQERAEVIKDYLVANGIGAERIAVKAWGGKRPLYDKHSANAQKNVRVEVEIDEE